MASNIKFKRSSVQNRVPTTAQLELGELALNTYDGKLYCEKNDGSASVVEIGQQLSVLVVDGDNGGGNGDVTFHGATANRDLLWDASANTLIARDNAIIAFGDTGTPDLKIFHDASNSYIQNITGNLILKNNSANYIIGVNATGAVELNHNGNKRFETTADGADVSGTGSLKLPVGTTAQRNSSPTAGDMRYNSTTGSFEGYTTGWGELGGSGIGIGSTSVNPGSGVVNPLIGVGFTTINFVGAGLSVTGYGSTVVVDLGSAVSRKYGRKIHSYTATNNQTTFTGMSYSNGAAQVSVYLNGAKLSAAAYTATSGNTVVLGTGASTGDEVEIIVIDSGVDITRTVHSFTATAGQTVFTGLGYEDGGDLDVYLNGIRLAQGDYTANNGTTLTLAVGASVGDLLEIVDMGPGAQWESGFGADTDDIYRMQGGVGIGTTNPTDKLNIVGNAEVLGVLTATTFKGDGSLLTGIVSDKIFEGNTSVETVDTGSNGSVTVTTEGTARVTVTNATTTVSNNLTVSGNLQVDGTQTTVNSTTMTVDDKNIVLGSGAANDAAADGGGITLESGNGNKTFNWVDATDAWTSSEHIHLGDNKRLKFGAGDDLNLYSTGTNGWVYTPQSGADLYMGTNAGEVYIQTGSSGNDTAIKVNSGGAVELYYNNSKKFETAGGGVNIIGDLYHPSDSSRSYYGASNDLAIWHDGSHSRIGAMDGGDGRLIISGRDGSANAIGLQLNAEDSKEAIICRVDGSVDLYHNGNKKLETLSTGAKVTGQLNFDDGSSTANTNGIGLGSSQDARIFHDGGSLQVRNTTGPTNFITPTHFGIFADSSNDAMFKALQDGAVELYYDNSKKLNTESWGVTVTGDIKAGDGKYLLLGDGNDFSIKHDGTHTILNNTHATGYTLLQVANGEYGAKLIPNGACELYYNNSKKLETTSSGISVTGNILPEANNTRSIGDGSTNFNSIWASNRFRGNDNVKLNLGDSQNFIIRHDGSDNLIESPVGDNLKIMMGVSDNANEVAATFNYNGACELYYNNSKKLETTTSGIEVFGQIQMDDNNILRLGNDGDMQIYHTGSHSHVSDRGGVGNLNIESNNQVNIKQNDAEHYMAKFIQGGAVELYNNNVKKFQTEGGNNAARIYGNTIIRSAADNMDIATFTDDGTNRVCNLYHNGSKKLETASWGVQFYGDLENNSDSTRIKLGASDNLQIYYDGTHSRIVDNRSSGTLRIQADGFKLIDKDAGSTMISADKGDQVKLYHNNGARGWTTSWGWQIGGHCIPNGDDSYNLGASNERWDNVYATNGTIQTSDRNEKNTIVSSDLGLSFVNKLKPVSYKFNGKTRTHYGLIAQDVETSLSDISKSTDDFAGFIKEDIPDVNYDKNDILPEGKNIGDLKKAAYTTYGLRYNEFIGPLVKAIQELSTEVETLKTKVNTE